MYLRSAVFALIWTIPIVKAAAFGIPVAAAADMTISQRQEGNMDTLESPFTIEINGKPILSVDPDDAGPPIQAKIGGSGDAALFTLKSGRLQSGGWVLARNATENRSMLPKYILWFKEDVQDDKIQPVAAEKDGDSYKLTFAGAPLTETDDLVFADLMGVGESTVTVNMQ